MSNCAPAAEDGPAKPNDLEESRQPDVVQENSGLGSISACPCIHLECDDAQRRQDDLKGSLLKYLLKIAADGNSIKEAPLHVLSRPYVGKHVPRRLAFHDRLPPPVDFRFNITRHWMETCKAVHGEHCRPLESSPEGPHWMINIHQNCIEVAPKAVEYATLSYVWGIQHEAVDRSCLTLRNYHQLLEPGSLDAHRFHLSPAIRQSITLAKELGFQYLWVDKVCIVQDGPTKQQQLDAMAAIYAGSALTIVAAYGSNEDDGLIDPNRVLPDTTTRPYSKRFVSGFEAYATKEYKKYKGIRAPALVEVYPGHKSLMGWQCEQLLRSSWYSRGWTFQESIFARRMILFHHNTFNWECHCTSWQEAQGVFPQSTQERCPRTILDGGSTLNPSLFPDMHQLTRLLYIYNQRELTFAEDAIDAFAGALSDLCKVFPQGFVSGMPVLFFDAMLMWQPSKPITRRVSTRARVLNQTKGDYILPSWSWVGWKGSIDVVSLKSAMSYMPEKELFTGTADQSTWNWGSWHTIPTISWSHTVELDVYMSRDPDILRPNFQLPADPEYLDKNPRINIPQLPNPRHLTDAQSGRFEVPDGWQKVWHRRTETWHYTHSKTGDQEFLYPIPLATGPAHTLGAINRSRFLYCRTRRAYLKGRKFSLSRSGCVCVELAPIDQDMHVAGVLRLNVDWESAHIHIVASELEDKPVELIELSYGFARNMDRGTGKYDFDEWVHQEKRWIYPEPRPKTYEFYNVMWIGRDESNDVAYRKAVGRVRKSVWEDIAKDCIDVTLG